MTSLTAHYSRVLCEEIINYCTKNNQYDLYNITKYIEYIRMYECNSLFFYDKPLLVLTGLLDSIYEKWSKTFFYKPSVELLKQKFKFIGFYERVMPSWDFTTEKELRKWKKENNFSNRLFQKTPHQYLSFFSSTLTSLTITEIAGKLPYLKYNNKKIKDIKIVHCDYIIPDNFECCLFLDAQDNYGLPISVAYSTIYDNEFKFLVKITLLRIEYDDEVDEVNIEYFNPWLPFLTNGENLNYSLGSELDTSLYKIVEIFTVDNLIALGRFVPHIEENILNCWTIKNSKFYSESPPTQTIALDFVNSYACCINLFNGTTFEDPKKLTRFEILNLVRETSEKHLCHILSRTKFTNTVSIIHTSNDYYLIYVTTVVKIGVRYRMIHCILISNNQDEFYNYLQTNWNNDINWIDETYFLNMSIRLARLPISDILVNKCTPVPISRIFIKNSQANELITNGLWKLPNCNCLQCRETRIHNFISNTISNYIC